jgi:hypothetical protein
MPLLGDYLLRVHVDEKLRMKRSNTTTASAIQSLTLAPSLNPVTSILHDNRLALLGFDLHVLELNAFRVTNLYSLFSGDGYVFQQDVFVWLSGKPRLRPPPCSWWP